MYFEYVLVENFIIDYFILACAGKLLKEKGKMLWVGSLLGSIIAVLCPLFNLAIWSSLLIKIFSSLLLTLVCFYNKKVKSFALNYIIFLLMTFVFGGAVEGLKQLIGSVTLEIALAVSFVLYVLLKIVIKIMNKKKIVDTFSAKVCIIDGDKRVEERGYYDSGNLLYDPVTSEPICLITHEVFCKLYGGDIINIFLNKIDEKKLKNGHYIDVNSAVKKGKMLVFSVDEIIVKDEKEEKRFENVCLGLTFSNFEKAMHSEVLLHSSQLCS